MLVSQNISYTYPKREAISYPDIRLSDQQDLLILGHSGSGKTTLLHILAGLLKPIHGEVHIDDQAIYTLSASELDQYRGKKIGMIFQQAFFMNAISVFENLAWAMHLAGNKIDENRIHSLLTRLNIGPHASHLPSRLSIGEQQRASIARALVNKPAIILADEPTSALDDHHTEQVIELLQEQTHLEGASLIIVTHDARIKKHFSNQITLAS